MQLIQVKISEGRLKTGPGEDYTCRRVNVMPRDGARPRVWHPLTRAAYLTATGEMTSLQKQNPQTSNVLKGRKKINKSFHAAVVAKILRLDIFHFSSQSRFPSGR